MLLRRQPQRLLVVLQPADKQRDVVAVFGPEQIAQHAHPRLSVEIFDGFQHRHDRFLRIVLDGHLDFDAAQSERREPFLELPALLVRRGEFRQQGVDGRGCDFRRLAHRQKRVGERGGLFGREPEHLGGSADARQHLHHVARLGGGVVGEVVEGVPELRHAVEPETVDVHQLGHALSGRIGAHIERRAHLRHDLREIGELLLGDAKLRPARGDRRQPVGGDGDLGGEPLEGGAEFFRFALAQIRHLHHVGHGALELDRLFDGKSRRDADRDGIDEFGAEHLPLLRHLPDADFVFVEIFDGGAESFELAVCFGRLFLGPIEIVCEFELFGRKRRDDRGRSLQSVFERARPFLRIVELFGEVELLAVQPGEFAIDPFDGPPEVRRLDLARLEIFREIQLRLFKGAYLFFGRFDLSFEPLDLFVVDAHARFQADLETAQFFDALFDLRDFWRERLVDVVEDLNALLVEIFDGAAEFGRFGHDGPKTVHRAADRRADDDFESKGF